MLIDPESAKAIGGGLTILASKEMLGKILGPTADYLGGELKNFAAKCNVNLDGIFAKAAKKLGSRIEEQGGVNPRVLKHVLDEGRFCEDELTAEYYGGILASSKGEVSRDDRGVTLLSELKALSVYQIRAHYVIYKLLHDAFKGNSVNLAESANMHKLKVFIEWPVFVSSLELGEGEDTNILIPHILNGLFRQGLIESYSFGGADHLKKQCSKITASGMIITPKYFGAELFVWCMGGAGGSGKELFTFEIAEAPSIPILGSAVSIEALNAEAS